MTANDPALLRRCKGARTTVSRRVCAYLHFGSFNTFVLPSNSFAFVWYVRTHSNETHGDGYAFWSNQRIAVA